MLSPKGEGVFSVQSPPRKPHLSVEHAARAEETTDAYSGSLLDLPQKCRGNGALRRKIELLADVNG